MKITRDYMFISEKVRKALCDKKPIVALESTIISHGMPYPKNVETALEAENLMKKSGIIPATIAILNGIPTIGLSESQIEFLGKNKKDVIKAGKRDIPVIMSRAQHGSTTVAATMYLANLAGIKVFATGGIGGVHKLGENTLDISADLEELAITDVAVVCAGAKSILDIGRTLEYLETKNIPVLGFETNEFPAFFTRKSGFKVPCRTDSPKEIAKILKTKWDMDFHGSVIISNPIPEEHEISEEVINKAIESACKEAERLKITGKNLTPFLLEKINILTFGESLDSNINLVYNNVKLAVKIAKELSDLYN